MRDRSGRTAFIVLSVLLLLSLSFNLFVAGAWFATRWTERPLGSAMRTMMQAYPQSVRQDVRNRLLAERDTVRTAVRALRDARERMFTLMRSEPLDREALRQAMADVRGKTSALQEVLQAALIESLAELPAAERQKIKPPGMGLRLFRGKDS